MRRNPASFVLIKGFENTSPGDHYHSTIDLSALSCLILYVQLLVFCQLKLETIINGKVRHVCLF